MPAVVLVIVLTRRKMSPTPLSLPIYRLDRPILSALITYYSFVLSKAKHFESGEVGDRKQVEGLVRLCVLRKENERWEKNWCKPALGFQRAPLGLSVWPNSNTCRVTTSPPHCWWSAQNHYQLIISSFEGGQTTDQAAKKRALKLQGPVEPSSLKSRAVCSCGPKMSPAERTCRPIWLA